MVTTTSGDDYGLASRWGWVVSRGVIAILFGLLALARPGATSLSLVILFGIYAFLGGIAAVVSAAQRGRRGSPWGMLLLDGVVGIAVGVLALLMPATMAVSLLWVIGFWAVVTGVMEIGSAINLRKVISNEWSLALAGVVSVAFGLLILFRPLAGGLALVWTLGVYALLFGALYTVLGFRLRSWDHGHGHHLGGLHGTV